jgi:hypothetical protein
MKVGNFRRLNPGDYPTFNDDGKTLMDQLNDIIEDLVTCLQGNVSADDNMNSETKTLEMVHATVREIQLKKVKGRVKEVQLIWSELFDFAQVAWEYVTESVVNVKILWTSAPTEAVSVTLRFIGA